MLELDRIAEQRLEEAVARGELDSLPGAGQPLELADDQMVPEELRMAYRVLKNAGFVPHGVSLRHDIGQAVAELNAERTDEGRTRIGKRLALLLTRLESDGGTSAAVMDTYREAIARRIQSEDESPPSRVRDG